MRRNDYSPTPMVAADFEVAPGRRMGWLEFGNPTDFPVFYCHGTPGSALEAKVFEPAARRRGVRVIAPDRPGVGRSTLHGPRTVADWADDLRALAEHLELQEFSIMGWSGGAPHALLAGARLASQVRAIGLLAPQGHAATWQSRAEHLLAPSFNTIVRQLLQIPRIGPKVASLSYWFDDLGHRQPRNPGLYCELFVESLHRGLAAGIAGSVEDAGALAGDWGLSMTQVGELLGAAIRPVPVTFWQGERDFIVRPAITLEMAGHLPNAQVHLDSRASHLQILLDHTDEVLRRMVKPRV